MIETMIINEGIKQGEKLWLGLNRKQQGVLFLVGMTLCAIGAYVKFKK